MVKIYIKNEVQLWVMTGLGKYHWIGWLRHWRKVSHGTERPGY